MKEEMQELQRRALEEIAAAANESELQKIRVAFLGKKGELTAILRGMMDLTAEERPVVGALAN